MSSERLLPRDSTCLVGVRHLLPSAACTGWKPDCFVLLCNLPEERCHAVPLPLVSVTAEGRSPQRTLSARRLLPTLDGLSLMRMMPQSSRMPLLRMRPIVFTSPLQHNIFFSMAHSQHSASFVTVQHSVPWNAAGRTTVRYTLDFTLIFSDYV